MKNEMIIEEDLKKLKTYINYCKTIEGICTATSDYMLSVVEDIEFLVNYNKKNNKEGMIVGYQSNISGLKSETNTIELEDIMKDFTVEVEYKPEIVEFSKKVNINITNIKNIELDAILFINDKLISALKENDSERIEIARELLNISIRNMLNKNNK